MCFYVSACAAIKLKLFSLSLSLFLSRVHPHHTRHQTQKKAVVSLCFFFSLSETPKGTQTSFFFLLGAATGVLRAIFGAFLGWAQALVAYGRCARRKKEQRVVGGENDDGRYKKIRISRAKEWKAV